MTVEKARFGGELDLPPEAEEMMAKITDLTGCAVLVIPADATQRFRDACESAGTTPQDVFACIMDGGVAGVFIQLASLEEPAPEPAPGSEQVNGKIH